MGLSQSQVSSLAIASTASEAVGEMAEFGRSAAPCCNLTYTTPDLKGIRNDARMQAVL